MLFSIQNQFYNNSKQLDVSATRVGSGQRALAPATLATARTPNVKDSASSPLKGTRSATVPMARLGCIVIKVGCTVFIMECSIVRPLLFPIRIDRTVGKLLGG